jgi:NADPH:quinone reductase-like Zn-dependent oxidoreductase
VRNIRAAFVWGVISSELLRTFAQLIDEGNIKAVVAARFPLRDASQAHVLSQTGHGRGRIVLHLSPRAICRT